MSHYIIAVTGGIASGKSLVCDRLRSHAIEVISADAVSRELVAPGQTALDEIVARFGTDIIDNQGQLQRRRLREIIFADSEARRDLEAILHPRVRVVLHERATKAQSIYAALEIPLLIDSKHYSWVNRIIAVDVAEAMQIQRLIQRDGVDESLARSMLAAQATRSERLKVASDVVANDFTLAALNIRIDNLHNLLCRAATLAAAHE